MGKYISKHVSQRLPEDKGARVVRFIGYKPRMRRACCRFSWNTTNGWLWRHKVAAFAGRFGLKDMNQLKRHFGPRWAYHLQGQILGERLDGERSIRHLFDKFSQRTTSSQNNCFR